MLKLQNLLTIPNNLINFEFKVATLFFPFKDYLSNTHTYTHTDFLEEKNGLN